MTTLINKQDVMALAKLTFDFSEALMRQQDEVARNDLFVQYQQDIHNLVEISMRTNGLVPMPVEINEEIAHAFWECYEKNDFSITKAYRKMIDINRSK